MSCNNGKFVILSVSVVLGVYMMLFGVYYQNYKQVNR